MRKLDVQKIALSYDAQPIVKGISFSITEGKITALIGPNGAGKSSIFRILSGLVSPDSGFVFLDGIQMKSFNDLRSHCGYLLETADFYAYLSGKKNLELLIALTRSSANATELLEMVGLAKDADKKVQHYSKGMKQRLGLAQVLIDNPSFLILDEPFNGLDPEVKELILKLLTDLKNKGKGILVSTHLLEDIETIADDFILLNEGEIYLSGSMETFGNDRQNVKMHFDVLLPQNLNLGFENCMNANVLTLKANEKETQTILKELYELDLIPYKIDRSSLLYDKYMEIIK
ncbi:ABC transporter ATP-binding protein [Flavobacterium granuli]|uniref:ABC-2 type transport system ATP-binding protein n=1 Tax=Flavobacterium granuli TaxID=280093 RepID=A0ABU1S0U0_9FLAO|nr:ABC transporter ATP-binding protein [Flavobacterium granuli]MDR6844643.1 ABC-2 type transport system ATP-binding protein [Flavobacterium granuli]